MTIHRPDQMIRHTAGNKAWNLKRLRDSDYPVPDFVILPTTSVQRLHNDPKTSEAACREILATLEPAGSVVIRSSALAEDGPGSAQAGQFHTVLDVATDDLKTALQTCLEHPKNQAAAQAGTLALIVQDHLPATVHGVFFTRHPQGKQNAVLEYSHDTSVVGGETVNRIEFHPNDLPATDLPIKQLVELGKKLERTWGWPQDIEWAVHNKELFLLQSRDITSITDPAWNGLLTAETILQEHEPPYYFEQNLLTEQFNHPTPLALSLLRSLYEPDGPVAAAYHAVGMQYLPQDIHRVIAGALYIDKEAELRSIFPSLSLYTTKFGKPRPAHWSGLGVTVKNLFASTFLRTAHTDELYERIKTALASPLPETSTPTERWQSFQAVYPLVYEISLRTQKALSLLPAQTNVPHGTIPYPILDPREYGLSPEQTLGNSLSLDDVSPFSYRLPTSEERPEEKATAAREVLRTRARTYLTLREYTRWLVVKHLHHFRQDIVAYANETLPESPDLISFATWQELVQGKIDQGTLDERAQEHRKTASLKPPPTLSSRTVPKKRSDTAGLAPGKAVGVVCTVSDLKNVVDNRPILYTKTLYPELTEWFPYIAGIITAEGGILSHLAIMAREHRIPVIKSEVPLNTLRQHLVEIDGDTGTLYTEEGTNIKS